MELHLIAQVFKFFLRFLDIVFAEKKLAGGHSLFHGRNGKGLRDGHKTDIFWITAAFICYCSDFPSDELQVIGDHFILE